MDITDKEGLWSKNHGQITNRKTKLYKAASNIPGGNTLAYMDYDTFIRKCGIAFNTGEWPQTHWKSDRITD